MRIFCYSFRISWFLKFGFITAILRHFEKKAFPASGTFIAAWSLSKYFIFPTYLSDISSMTIRRSSFSIQRAFLLEITRNDAEFGSYLQLLCFSLISIDLPVTSCFRCAYKHFYSSLVLTGTSSSVTKAFPDKWSLKPAMESGS